MMHVKLAREPHNPKDENSTMIRNAAAVLAPIMDLLPEMITKWFVCSYQMHSVLPSCFAVLVSLENKTLCVSSNKSIALQQLLNEYCSSDVRYEVYYCTMAG